MKIFICGYMGAGKTTVGRILAHNLNLSFNDLDDEIENHEDENISDLFQKKGEIYFRRKEKKVLEHFLKIEQSQILALGGGTTCYGNNLKLIKEKSEVKLIYLKSSAENLANKLFTEKDSRPLIQHLETKEELLEFIQKHLFERNFYYNQSDLIISVNDKTPLQIAGEISEKLN